MGDRVCFASFRLVSFPLVRFRLGSGGRGQWDNGAMGQWGRSFIHTGGLLLSAVHNNTRARELAGRKERGGGKGSFFLCTFCQWHFDTERPGDGRRETGVCARKPDEGILAV